MLEAVEGVLYLLEVPKVFCLLEVVKGVRYVLELLEVVFYLLEVMLCVLLCMLGAVEGELCLLEVMCCMRTYHLSFVAQKRA